MYPFSGTCARVAAAFVTGAYAVPVFLQFVYELPHPETNTPFLVRFLEACNPKRILRLWGPIFGQLKLILLAPKWRRWIRDYQLLPDKLKSHEFGSKFDSRVDFYPPAAANDATAPVLIFVYGGAWSAGSREMYGTLGTQMASIGFMSVVPDYVKYPNGDISDIVSDVLRCIIWLRKGAAARFGGNANKIVLVGHSAGAHICATIIATLFAKCKEQSSAKTIGVSVTELCPQLERELTQTASESLLEDIFAFVGLAGVYHIDDHFRHESSRGIEHVSVMERVMNRKSSFCRNSPLVILGSLLNGNSSVKFPICHLFHGENDATVPVQSSENFASVLRELAAPENVQVHRLKNVDHVEILVSLMECNERYPPTLATHRLWGVLTEILESMKEYDSPS